MFINIIVNNDYLKTAKFLFSNISLEEELEKRLEKCEYNQTYQYIIDQIIKEHKNYLQYMFVKYSEYNINKKRKQDINVDKWNRDVDEEDLKFEKINKFWYNFFRYLFIDTSKELKYCILNNPLFKDNVEILERYLYIYMDNEFLHKCEEIKLLMKLIDVNLEYLKMIKNESIIRYLEHIPDDKIVIYVDKLIDNAIKELDKKIIYNIVVTYFERLKMILIKNMVFNRTGTCVINEDTIKKLIELNDKNIIKYLKEHGYRKK